MKYYTDGFVTGHNPSKFGGGYTIVDEHNNLIKREEIEKVGFTNNEGELLGVLEALRMCKYGDSISTDSMNTMTWVFKGRSKARPDFNDLMMEAHNLLTDKHINLMWERRDYNLAGILNEKLMKERRKFYTSKPKHAINGECIIAKYERDVQEQKELFEYALEREDGVTIIKKFRI